MQPSVVIVGTRHTYQAGGKNCANENAELLRNFLLNACREWSLSGIAEEMSSDGLVYYQSIQSVPSRVATELELSHRYCDPTNSERVRVGIIGPGEIELEVKQNSLSEDEKINRLAAEEIRREQYWLKELQNQNVWPTLFVCGPNHVMSFKSLLDSVGHATHVLVEDWEPNAIIERGRMGRA
ncbi:MAG: hypothetical protein M0R41_00890 [Methylobacter tundripaludum]|uniref:Uncharacterized protein n=1 Tax=Methylobacter tundripaludum TaxID=173365 RepID=A0A2S6GFW3_9GAMM|nr:hypothetical protein [Methylobacter tundripaludum]MCK9634819.1 hypothetical protein [Methylobacter tundripaludum]PPK64118.1 hypothetical protein B0F88_1289 [Methylobacter tundripaludum]